MADPATDDVMMPVDAGAAPVAAPPPAKVTDSPEVAKANAIVKDAPPMFARKPVAAAPAEDKNSGQQGGDWFGQNRSWLIPLLSGVGGMASSDSRYLGSAILQGLGKGAQAYAGEQQAEGNLASTQGQNRQRDVDTAQKSLNLHKSGRWIDPASGIPMVTLDGGGGDMSYAKWLEMDAAGNAPKIVGEDLLRASMRQTGKTNPPAVYSGGPGGPSTVGGAGAGAGVGAGGDDGAKAPGAGGPGSSIMPAPVAPLPKTAVEASTGVGEVGRAIMEQKQSLNARNPADYEKERVQALPLEKNIQDEAIAARKDRVPLYTLADKLLQLPDDDSLLKADVLADVTHNVGNYWNAALGRAAVLFPDKKDEIAKMMLNEKDLENGVAADKYTSARQFLVAGGAGQHALGALSEAAKGIPGKHMTKDAGIAVFQGLFKDQQRAIDRDAYVNDWNTIAKSNHATMNRTTVLDADRAFEKEHGDRYGREGNLFEEIMKAKHGTTHRHLLSDIQSGKMSPDDIEKHKGWENMSRWFRNYGG